jgi:murein DD-endopeptidase MepM/ murein hydrolase activator NlpD
MTNFLERSVLILLASTALTACVSSPYEPRMVSLPPPAAPAAKPPQAAAADKPLVIPQAAAPVDSRPLGALAPARPAEAQVAQAPTVTPPPVAPPAKAVAPPGVPAYEVEEPPKEPAYRTVTTRSVTGRVVEVEGEPQTYKVRKGDTLEKIANRLDTEIEQLAKDNKLRKPYRLQPGQTLKGPRQPAKAYVVGQGDTLFSIARRFNVSVDALRSENDLARNAAIAPGRRLRLPSGYRDRGPITTSTRVEVDQGGPVRPAPQRPSQPVAEPPAPAVQESQARSETRPETRPETRSETRTVTSRSVTGRVVEISLPGKAYKVRKGDSLEKIARKLDSEVDDLARLNKLKRPYRLHPGQTIRGPGSSAKAYVVGSGDTFAAIARRFDVSTEELRAANGLRRGASVAPGRKLRLPAGYRDRGPVTVTTEVPAERAPPASSFRGPPPVGQTLPPPRSASEALPSAPQPYTPSGRPYTPPRTYTPGGVTGAPQASAPISDAQIMQMGRGLFAWPIRGDVISGFGGKGTGQRNDGLNIRAAAGEAVQAAAAGDVVYAGDQVPGFGNLVLIKHADGWVTAYGHLSRVDVRMQQKVGQGQQIGQVGSTGGVSEPQLHFEVRYAPSPQERARPVDPELVLPK